MINCCIIGVSGFGQVHYNDLIREVERGRAEAVAAAIINQDEEAEKCETLRQLGCTIYDDYKAMLAVHGQEADLCMIPTGIHLHRPMTVDALRAGMNVFVEKPAAGTVQDVRAMQEAERDTGRFVAVGYQTMYQADTMLMKTAILDGWLGAIQAIKCIGKWPRPDAYYERNNWAGCLRVGEHWVLDSPFNNAIAHQLNMICFLAGTTVEESAELASVQAELYRANSIESADTAALRILTKDGVPLLFYVTHCPEQALDPRIVVRGEKGTMTWQMNGQLTIDISDGTNETHPIECDRSRIFDALEKRVRGEDAFVCDLAIAGVQTTVVNGAHESNVVRAIPQEQIKRVPHEGSTRSIVTGLDAVMDKAFADEVLFSDADAPWAAPAPVFSLEGYHEFHGAREEQAI